MLLVVELGLEGLVLAKLGASVTFLDHVQDALQLQMPNNYFIKIQVILLIEYN